MSIAERLMEPRSLKQVLTKPKHDGRVSSLKRTSEMASMVANFAKQARIEFLDPQWQEEIFGLDEDGLVPNTLMCRAMMALLRAHQKLTPETIYKAGLGESFDQRPHPYSINVDSPFNEPFEKARENNPKLAEWLLKNQEGKLFATEVVQLANIALRLDKSHTPDDVERYTRGAFFQSFSDHEINLGNDKLSPRSLIQLSQAMAKGLSASINFVAGNSPSGWTLMWEYDINT